MLSLIVCLIVRQCVFNPFRLANLGNLGRSISNLHALPNHRQCAVRSEGDLCARPILGRCSAVFRAFHLRRWRLVIANKQLLCYQRISAILFDQRFVAFATVASARLPVSDEQLTKFRFLNFSNV